jgi:hypothetical protein
LGRAYPSSIGRWRIGFGFADTTYRRIDRFGAAAR